MMGAHALLYWTHVLWEGKELKCVRASVDGERGIQRWL